MAEHVVVLGAGYAGLVAAKLTARYTGARVTLVNASDRFTERVRLHQLASGQALRDRPLSRLVRGSGVDLVVDRVTAIDAGRKRVTLKRRERPLEYDILVYALGSRADLHSVPGAEEYAYSVSTPEEAARLWERIASGRRVSTPVAVPIPRMLEGGLTGHGPGAGIRSGGRAPERAARGRQHLHRETVAVVGGGLTGIETATELAETFPHLRVLLLTEGELGGRLSLKGRMHLSRVCERLGIDVRDDVRVGEVLPDGVRLAGGDRIEAGIVVWATGFRVPPSAREAGLAVNEHGRLLVDQTLRSVSHPEVYGVGDAAAAQRLGGQEMRMACATGIPVAHHAARAIADRMAGRSPRPLRFRYVLQCISLGRRDALIQFVNDDDSPREAVITGRRAALAKELIVRGAAYAQRRPGLAAFAALG